MEATLNEYKDAVKAQVDACTDVSLLDLIFKLFDFSPKWGKVEYR